MNQEKMQQPQLPIDIGAKFTGMSNLPFGTPAEFMQVPTRSTGPVIPVPISRSHSVPVSQVFQRSRQLITSSSAKKAEQKKQTKRIRWSKEEDVKLRRYLAIATLPNGIEKEFPGRKRTSIVNRFSKLKKSVWSKITRVDKKTSSLYEPKTKRIRDDLDETIDDDSNRMAKTARFGRNPEMFFTKAQTKSYVDVLAEKDLKIAKLTKALKETVNKCNRNYNAYMAVKIKNDELKSSMSLISKLSSIGSV